MRAPNEVTHREARPVTEPTPAPLPWFELRMGSVYIKAERFPAKTVAALLGAVSALWPIWETLGR